MRISGSQQLARWKRRRWTEHPYCHWCGRRVRIYRRLKGTKPDDEATVNHVYHKRDVRRRIINLNEVRRVLACRGCNQARAVAFMERHKALRRIHSQILTIILCRGG